METLIILVVVLVIVFFAVRSVLKQRKSGGCGCGDGCTSCGGQCHPDTSSHTDSQGLD